MWNSSNDAERAVIGCMLLDGNVLADTCRLLSEKDFTDHALSALFKAAKGMYLSGTPVDLVTVAEAAHAIDEIDPMTVASYLSGLSREVPATVNFMHYVRIVREKATRRKADKINQALAAAVKDESRDIAEVKAKALAAIAELSVDEEAKEDPSAEAVIMATIAYAQQRITAKDTNLTGIPDIDRAMGGLHPGELTILAARPAEGKSTLAWQIGEQFARRGQRVMFVSGEMSQEQLGARWFAMGGVNTERLRQGRMTDGDWERMYDLTPELSQIPMRVHTKLRTPQEIAKEVSGYIEHGGLGLVIIDYLQLLSAGVRAQNQNDEVSKISRALKLMTTEYRIPLLVLSQLNRGPESRANRMPVLKDLRDSGALEQDADNVIFLMTPKRPEDVPSVDMDEYNAAQRAGNRLTYCSIAKQRNGPLMDCKLEFRPSQMRMYSKDYDFIPVDDQGMEGGI